VSWYGVQARPATEPEVESDEELRERLRYVGAWPVAAVETSKGEALDDLASRFNLRRRR
jgi:hypothetical protein